MAWRICRPTDSARLGCLDIQAIFDLLSLCNPGKDARKGFNVHTIVLNIPLDEIGGDRQVVGVYATTSRPASREGRLASRTMRAFPDWESSVGMSW